MKKSIIISLIIMLLFTSAMFAADEPTTDTQAVQQADTQAATPVKKAKPKIKLFGSIRYRFQYDSSTVEDITTGTTGDTQKKEQQRLRLRLGLKANIFKGVQAGLELTTPDPDATVSHNETLGNSMGTKPISILQAYMHLLPFGKILRFTFGKFKNPIKHSKLMFASEIHPEGLNQHLMFKLGSGMKLGLNLGEWVLDKEKTFGGNTKYSRWILSAQPYFKMKMGKAALTFAVGFFGWTNRQGIDTNDTEMDYKILQVYLDFKMKFGNIPFKIAVEWTYNLGDAQRSSSGLAADLKKKKHALQAFVQFGKLKKLYSWIAKVAFRSVQRYALDPTLTTDDYTYKYSGYLTNWCTMGIYGKVGFVFLPNTSLYVEFFYNKLKLSGYDVPGNAREFKKNTKIKVNFLVKF